MAEKELKSILEVKLKCLECHLVVKVKDAIYDGDESRSGLKFESDGTMGCPKCFYIRQKCVMLCQPDTKKEGIMAKCTNAKCGKCGTVLLQYIKPQFEFLYCPRIFCDKCNEYVSVRIRGKKAGYYDQQKFMREDAKQMANLVQKRRLESK